MRQFLPYVVGGLAALALSLNPARAQENKQIGYYPAEKFAIAPGGVDLRTLRYVYSNTDLSIGADGGALKLTRIMPDYAGNHANPFGNFSHNWDIFLLERQLQYDETLEHSAVRMTLHMGGRAYSFEGAAAGSGYSFKSDGPIGSLTLTGGGTKSSSTAVNTAVLPDGTELIFRQMGGLDCSTATVMGSARRCASVSEMTEPDGTRYTFTYAYDGAQPGNRARLTQVVSSRGYALLLEGSGSIVTKACVLNLATTTIPGSGLCTAGVPTTTYAYTQNNTKLAAVTDAAGATSQFSYIVNGSNISMGFIKPGETSPWLTNYIIKAADEEFSDQETMIGQAFADGRTYSYTTGTSTDQSGRTIIYQFDAPIVPGTRTLYCDNPPCSVDQPDAFYTWTYQRTPGPVLVQDELGRGTTADYCDPAVMAGLPSWEQDRCAVVPMVSFTDPEGIKTALEYDGRNNVRKSTRYAKPGSSLPPIVTEAAYAITNIKTQTKPLWVKDGNGNQTDYTYDSVHGRVLTETGPTVNGVRPQKRYSYEYRSAWISNGSGGYVASEGAFLLMSESFCKTSGWTGSACSAGAADEVVTAYDYGPNSGPNNLLLRGTTVTADGVTRRTCFGYDSLGRRISQTTPNANLASCP